MPTWPGCFEVRTRIDAQHLVGTLDTTLHAPGYAPPGTGAGTAHYRARTFGWLGTRRREIAVTLRARRIEIIGPIATLRWLQWLMVI